MNKTLLASALILGLGNASTASSETFTMTVGAIADVEIVAPEVTNTAISFGDGVKGTTVGGVCTLLGVSEIDEGLLQFDRPVGGTPGTRDNSGDTTTTLSGTACVSGTGEPMIISITGASGALVSVNVPDYNDGTVSYTPTAESCIVDWNGDTTTTLDVCRSLENNTVTNIGLMTTDFATEEDASIAVIDLGATGGTTRMVLAGEIEILQALTADSTTSIDIDVIVTYE